MTDNLDEISDRIRHTLSSRDAAREKALPLCRELIRYSSVTIRAIHRQEFEQAKEYLVSARKLLGDIARVTDEWQELRYTGYVRDAQKEFCEANTTYALVRGEPFPTPEELEIDPPAYLNGLGDTIGELRRYLLDSMRRGDLSRGEELLGAMDDIYSVLVTMDFPDAVTGGLRHTTDNVRGILEKTRGDLTLAAREKALESKIADFESKQS